MTTTNPPEPAAPEPASPEPAAPAPAGSRFGGLRFTRISRAHLLAGLLLGLLGFSLVVQAKETRSNNLSTLSQGDLVRLLDDVTRRSDRLDVEARQLQQTDEQLRTGSDRAAAAQTAARQRLEVLGILAGTLPAQGPGITLQIDDPKAGVDAAELVDTVEELRDAGAEALQIGTLGSTAMQNGPVQNGVVVHTVRVVANTAFVDTAAVGKGVVVDGTTLTPPYVLTAIGDPQTLDSALDIPGGVLDTLRQGEAHGTVRRDPEVTISAVRAVTTPKYAVPDGGN